MPLLYIFISLGFIGGMIFLTFVISLFLKHKNTLAEAIYTEDIVQEEVNNHNI